MSSDTKNFCALANIKLKILVSAFVCQLGHTSVLGRELIVEQIGQVTWNLFTVLQTRLNSLRNIDDIRYIVVLVHVRVLAVDLIQKTRVISQILDQNLEQLSVLLFVYVAVVENVRRAKSAHSALARFLERKAVRTGRRGTAIDSAQRPFDRKTN
ncbi:hypothetical protein BpHYR1_007627 [Brachionus plicatilis]|uniref:Uncharacterized protein n=1 Tax=Brachionus plicatilis TaxID=10195 RepID=A0A3M7RD64_BRAPC|nr:hypothetical protein BpHYR1_007627 [Brachionus plicatilis]